MDELEQLRAEIIALKEKIAQLEHDLKAKDETYLKIVNSVYASVIKEPEPEA